MRSAPVRAIVDLAHGLGMYIVVEGIKTGRQREIVKSLNADFAQGYLFARPMSAEHIGKWLSEPPAT
jgi:EAL domain-containing protein (putative c-di-GMP-specific phosphodiesterase class I)